MRMSNAEAKKRVQTFYKLGPSVSAARQYGKLWFTSFGEGLVRFYARRVRAGRSTQFETMAGGHGWIGVQLYSVKVNAWGAPFIKDDKRTFMAKVHGREHVFQRMSEKRLPIEKVLGPGMSELVQVSGIFKSLGQLAQARYEKEFDHNLKFYVDQAVKKAMATKG